MGNVVQLRAEHKPVTSVKEPVRPLAEARAHLVNSIDTAWDLLRWLSERGHEEIALDTETTGLSKIRDHVRLVQIADGMDGWAIPFERWGGVIDDVVKRFKGFYLMHNAPFDWSMLAKEKIEIPQGKIHDTRIMAHVISSTGSLALKQLSQRLVDPAANAAKQELEAGIGTHGGWSWENVPVDYTPYWMYGALDGILTYRLKQILYPQVMQDAPASYQLEMQVTWPCVRMELKGALVDREYTQKLADELSAYCNEVELWCKTHYGVAPGSYDVAGKLIAEGVQLSRLTASGRYCLDQEVLSNIDHPLAQTVLSRRKALKLVSTYLTHYLEDSIFDGRVHPSINVVGGSAKNPFEPGGGRGVRTGRMSMDDPNLQNVPIHTDVGKKIRNCFPASEGNTWIKYDAEQIEMRIFAHLAEDPRLIDAFVQARQGGPDMFTRSTRDIFRDTTIVKDDLRRQHVKNGFYAILYAAGLEQFARTAGIYHEVTVYDAGTQQVRVQPDLANAQAFLSALHSTYPGIKDLQRKVEYEALSRKTTEGEAYVRSFLTNRKHTADEGREYALMNYLVQGAAGEILKLKIIEADHAGLGEYMMFPVHDEIDFDVPNAELPDVLRTLDEVMNDDRIIAPVPLTWSAETGERWGACS